VSEKNHIVEFDLKQTQKLANPKRESHFVEETSLGVSSIYISGLEEIIITQSRKSRQKKPNLKKAKKFFFYFFA
jgi:hypothetical protein